MFELMIGETCTLDGIEYKRVANDTYGNPRVVVHFTTLPTSLVEANPLIGKSASIEAHYAEALRVLGGKRYRGRDYGGGIVFQSHSLRYTHERIMRKITKRAEILGVAIA